MCFEQNGKIENLASKLYKLFHTIFIYDSEASYFFYKMSIEEKGHRNLVQYVKRLVRQNHKLFSNISTNLEHLEIIEKKLEEEIKKSSHYDLLQAIDIIEEIEISSGEGYLRNLPLSNNSILTDLYGSLGEQDHTEKITAFRTKINARV